jgi:predicted patatin/cPLA2 family phospholipase
MRLQHTLTRDDLASLAPLGHPIVELMLQRASNRSRRGERTDDAVLAVAVEGGGMRGVVSAGMCVVLEQAGLIDAVDVIYGVSSGALNASFTAAGQAALGSTNYIDTASGRFANPLRMLWGQTAVDLDLLFDELIRDRKPYFPDGLAAGPPFRGLAVDLTTSELRVLRDFVDVEDLINAVRASCALPLLSSTPVSYRGVPMADGGLIESIPYASALADGATHVLVLRSRPPNYRQRPHRPAVIDVARRIGHPALPPLIEAHPELYNQQAAHLELTARDDPTLVQIAPDTGGRKIHQLERSPTAVRHGLIAGANATAEAFGLPTIDLFWQPELYTKA